MECYGSVKSDASYLRGVCTALAKSKLPEVFARRELTRDRNFYVFFPEGGAEDNAAFKLNLDGFAVLQSRVRDIFSQDAAEDVSVLGLAKSVRAFLTEDIRPGEKSQRRAANGLAEMESEVILNKLDRGEFKTDKGG
jgi:hypothetical protein